MIGTTLSHFKITAKLGEGGMGEVYRAEDTKLGREVAIKVLPEAVANDPERLARFEREARVLASLNHPHIAAIHAIESAQWAGASPAPTEEGVGEGLAPSRDAVEGLAPFHPEGGEVPAEADDRRAERQHPPAQRDGHPSRPVHFLVMELVEGEDLKQRLERGRIPVEEALPIAFQMAEALEVAHEQGIVHRDLKPANVVVDEDGQVKVLDFGLAKALDSESDSMIASGLSMSPTLTAQMTGAGVILGTAAYMSPEQARGKRVDRRSDVWSFGCVLFEMLSGVTAYGGETVTDILGAIVHKEPDWESLPQETPRPMRKLLARCLEKDPRRRLQAIGEARLAIEDYLDDPQASAAETEPSAQATAVVPRWRRILPWALAGALAVAVAAMLLRPATDASLVQASIQPPVDHVFHLHPFNPGPVVLSPEGSHLAFSARDSDGRVSLYVRSLAASQAEALTGTEDAQYPFWSPDGKWIAFFNSEDQTLKKIRIDGGLPTTLCAAPDGKGGSWSEQGIIVFAPTSDSTIHRVSASGGESTPLFPREESRFNSYRHPRFLSDGDHFLFVARANRNKLQLMIGSLDGQGQPRELMSTGSQAEVAGGHLFFTRERRLMVQPFDEEKLELVGEAVPIAESVLKMPGVALAVFSVSRSGELVYQTGRISDDVGLTWVDRNGNETGSLGDPGVYRTVIISPDGRHALAAIEEAESGTFDLWLFEMERSIGTRFTFGEADERMAAWMPDNRTVIYSSEDGGRSRFLRKSLDTASEPEVLLEIEDSAWPTSVSPDGLQLVYQVGDIDGNGNLDLWVLPLDGNGQPRAYRQTEFNEAYALISPDGEWLVYLSDESGRLESYVDSFPEPGRRWRVSTGSGVYPYWREDGGEIFYHELAGQVMAASVEPTAEGLRLGQPQSLFQMATPSWGGAFYAPTPSGRQFLITPSPEQDVDPLVQLVVNWPAVLEER